MVCRRQRLTRAARGNPRQHRGNGQDKPTDSRCVRPSSKHSVQSLLFLIKARQEPPTFWHQGNVGGPFASSDADNPRAFSERGFIGRLNRMSQVHDTSVIDRLLEPFGRALTPAMARALVDLRAPSEDQDRIDELAEKCNEGSLSAEERAEYEDYIRVIHFLGIVQAKARAILAREPGQP